MIAHYKDVDTKCVDPNVDDDPKKQGIFISPMEGAYRGVTLVFSRATHKEIDALAAELRRLGLTEVRVD